MGRAVKLKLLRKIAEDTTVGLPYVRYGEIKHKKRVRGPDGKPLTVLRVQRVMVSKCTRRVYKDLKQLNPPGSMRIRKRADSGNEEAR